MRPVRLTMKGFTAFRDEQQLDFGDLDLFALSGPTGSGKSSVLDAMTYALYGKAERVEGARDVSLTELVTHGQKRMAVTLDFDVGGRRYRVTRSTPRTGASKALLEVAEGEGWRSHGEGADRVREVNMMIRSLIGLDYDAFTRSVILPQGKFAEFLTGDAARRRRILTELLGLELFSEMGVHANRIAREARIRLETNLKHLAEGFAGVTTEALEAAHEEATAAEERAAALDEVARAIGDHIRRAEDVRRSRSDIERCGRQVRTLADAFADHVEDLARIEKRTGTLEEELAAAVIDVEKATDALEGARADRSKAEAQWGTREVLIEVRTRLELLNHRKGEAEAADAALSAAHDAEENAGDRIGTIEDATATARATAGSARSAAVAAQGALQQAQRDDLIAAVARGVSVGDPCPICGHAVESVPHVEAHALAEAERAAEEAVAAAARADAELTELERSLAVARHDAEAAAERLETCRRDAATRRAAVEELGTTIADVLGARIREDPGAEIGSRLAELDELGAAIESAEERVARAKEDVASLERARDAAHHRIATIRAEMVGARAAAPIAEAGELLGPDDVGTPPDLPDEGSALLNAARASVELLEDLAQRLDGARAVREDELATLRADAAALLPAEIRPDIRDIADLADIAGIAADLRDRARDELVEARARRDALADGLQRKEALEVEIAALRHERDLYAELATQLRTDRIVDHLQAEALVTLATTGSVHLERLSDHRYRLAYEDERFHVIDAWNADERRSVRTLSGGETFLASLALALALAEGVQLLAVTEKHRLESLFLDEGFGTLDPESLKAVVDALERLGHEDRLVGVITHVAALADEMPVRIEVVKAPGGSRLQRDVSTRAAK